MGALGQERTRERHHGLEVGDRERGAELGVPFELAVEHGLNEGPEAQGVVRAEEVDRPSHHDDAHERACLEEAARPLRDRRARARDHRPT